MNCVFGCRQAVVGELRIPLHFHESSAPKIGQVPRNGRLGKSQDFDDIAYA